MRWFCVDPGLPEQAQLRVRAQPSSAAPEVVRRVDKGLVVAVVAPAFDVLDGDGSPQRWVRVAIQGVDGFMLQSLPDGTPLLASWEKAGFRSCCRVDNPKAFLFDSPSRAAQVVGLVDLVDLPYGIHEVEGGRALVQHPEYGMVWIDTAELDPVCLLVHHAGCSG